MRSKIFIIAAMAAALFSSCQKDFSEENGDLPAGVQSGQESHFVNNSGCKDCEYVPMCSGSVYKYKDTDPNGIVHTVDYTLDYRKDTVIDGRNYKKFTAGSNSFHYLNCSSGISSSIITDNSTTVAGSKRTLLKANESVGTAWTDIINDHGTVINYSSTITEKNISVTVNGITYPDVVHVLVYGIINMPNGTSARTPRTDYYYAKGKGLIKSRAEDMNGSVSLRELISATIPN